MRGFKIGKRTIRISRWIFRRSGKASACNRLGSPEPTCRSKSVGKLISWGRRLTSRAAKSLCFMKPRSGYMRLGHDPFSVKPVTVPKGHLAVYVGQEDGDFCRVLVPVIYINHPLFGQLLREAEEEYGFNQQGGITIPCRFSEFESVQTRIASGSGGSRLAWKRSHF